VDDVIYSVDHGLADAAAGDIVDQRSVQFHVVDLELLKIIESAEAGAKVIERETAAQFAARPPRAY
jgi:hypothetical protein